MRLTALGVAMCRLRLHRHLAAEAVPEAVRLLWSTVAFIPIMEPWKRLEVRVVPIRLMEPGRVVMAVLVAIPEP